MGTGKKESARRARQSKPGDQKMSTPHTKGENFYRSAKRVKTLNMFKSGAPTRNARGDITSAAAYQGTEKPRARIEPHRKWFTNTRVISQDALSAFREAVEERAKDPYSVLLKRNKLPMSLISDGNQDKERKDGLVMHKAKMRIEGEAFGDTFGPKAQRKRVRLDVGSLEDMAKRTEKEQVGYEGKMVEEERGDVEMGEEAESAENTTAKEPIFSKGQSKRIWNELYKVIDSSDVVIHVLDARDPLGTRCRSVEKYIREEAPHKHLLFLLNKCDLVPTSVAAKWTRHLSLSHPTLAFHASLTNSFGKGTLISLLRQFSALHPSRKQISVGFIGYPNTGKSSIINTLRRKRVCKTAPLPGETKVWQYITLMKRIYLIDCPGIVPPEMGAREEEVLLRGVVRVENVEDPAQYIPGVLRRCRRRYLERTYGISGWADGEGDGDGVERGAEERMEEAMRFLEILARKGGRLLKGGEPDLDAVAKMVLNDFLRGKIPWFVPPPDDNLDGKEVEGEEEVDSVVAKTLGKRKRAGDGEAVDVAVAEEEANGEAESEFESFDDDDEDDESSSESGEDVEGAEDGGVGIAEGDSGDDISS